MMNSVDFILTCHQIDILSFEKARVLTSTDDLLTCIHLTEQHDLSIEPSHTKVLTLQSALLVFGVST